MMYCYYLSTSASVEIRDRTFVKKKDGMFAQN